MGRRSISQASRKANLAKARDARGSLNAGFVDPASQERECFDPRSPPPGRVSLESASSSSSFQPPYQVSPSSFGASDDPISGTPAALFSSPPNPGSASLFSQSFPAPDVQDYFRDSLGSADLPATLPYFPETPLLGTPRFIKSPARKRVRTNATPGVATRRVVQHSSTAGRAAVSALASSSGRVMQRQFSTMSAPRLAVIGSEATVDAVDTPRRAMQSGRNDFSITCTSAPVLPGAKFPTA